MIASFELLYGTLAIHQFVRRTRRLLRSVRVFKAATLSLDTKLSPSQCPNWRRVSTDLGLASIDILLGILVFRSFLPMPLCLRLRLRTPRRN